MKNCSFKPYSFRSVVHFLYFSCNKQIRFPGSVNLKIHKIFHQPKPFFTFANKIKSLTGVQKLKTYVTFFFLVNTLLVYAQQKNIQNDSIHSQDSIIIRNIRLHEVKVIAHENYSTSTSSVIGREAIQHVQPFSLAELMQLLPGGLTPEVSFQSPTYFNIRSASSSLGTGISIDGVRVSTNADLQQQNDMFGFGRIAAQYGPDTRTLSTDNIETLEVIRGIPSVRYGDITSGMVIVHTRQNARPYTASVRITPEIKSFNASKGWETAQKDVFNLMAGYTRANSDINTSYNIYDRITLQTGYIAHFNQNKRPLILRTGADCDITINHNPANTKLQLGEYIDNNRQSLRFYFSGNWQSRLQALSEVNWKTSVEYGNSVSKYNHYNSGNIYTAQTSATMEGEGQGFFLPPKYWDLGRIESRPLSISANLTANLRKSGSSWKSRTSLGIEWTGEGNKGKGKSYGYHTPSHPAQNRYDFGTLPFMHHYAIYAEENFQTTRFSIEGGIRLTAISAGEIHFRPTAEPRLNLNYTLLQRPQSKYIRQLQVKAGIGLLRKMPTLGYLFSEPQYHNFTNFSYHDETSGEALAVITTYISNLTGTESIQLPQNLKTELGISGLWGNFSFDLTGFYEKQKHGFGQNQTARPATYRKYNNPNKPGQTVTYRDGEVYIGDRPAGYTNDTTFILSPAVNNHLYEQKGGLEFVFRSDYIHALATTFVLDGIWIVRRTENKSIVPNYNNISTGGRSYGMCAFFDNSNTANIFQQLNTTLRAITEIPSIRLTTTLALQSVWMERSQTRIKNQADSRFYMLGDNGNRIETGLNKESEATKYQDPVYYMDTQGNTHPFTSGMANDPAYKAMVKTYYSGTFLKNKYSPYFLLNLRMTKKVGQNIGLTFFANNLAGMNPKKYHASTGQYVIMNVPSFFGLELQIKI